ncbi:hypothetical protein Pst134EB_001394 [Puccinia striiformis f. sp. tritici]|nr:hypothetical protein Pst134EB_001394 [Puccinia striiformis f. sp. tritici]
MIPIKLSWAVLNANTLFTLICALNLLICVPVSSPRPFSTDPHVADSPSPNTTRGQNQAFQKNKSASLSKKPIAPPQTKPPAPLPKRPLAPLSKKPPATKSPPKLPNQPQQPSQKGQKNTEQKAVPSQTKPDHQAAKQTAFHTGGPTNQTTAQSSHPNRLSVLTTSGTYLGFTNQSRHSVDTWLGVRYAVPPIGDLRFRAPVLLDSHQEDDGKTQLAFEFGDACPQPAFDPPLVPEVDISEDCLHLNLYRPSSSKPDSRLPVLVWIHGGGYTYGTAASTDGAVLVSSSFDLHKPIIFVSMNYRLGPFGFLNTEDLPAEDLQVGLKDQITCLKWLRLNIAAFGGGSR